MTLAQLFAWTMQSVVLAIAIWFVAGLVDALLYELRREYLRDPDDRTLFRASPRHRRWWRSLARR